MTVKELYNKWNDQLKRGEIRADGIFSFPEIVYEIRESNKIWNDKDINCFTEYLKNNDYKWFVANLFALQENIPEQLLEPFINAAIDEPDPSFNRKFINPCLRVFGFEKVFELLDKRFLEGNKPIKIGVCNAYYWARSPLVYVSNRNGPLETKGYLSKWNGNYYGDYDWDTDSHFEMEELKVLECEKITNRLLAKRRKLLIEEFLSNHDTDLRYHIKLALPDKFTSFSHENKELAISYLEELKKDFVPDHYQELKLKKRLGIFGKNRLVCSFLNWKRRRDRNKELLTFKK
ncbi:hypothetical protein [Flexithrix dorotheae]|uniref:hypothetical protein n=1 Tax=Flexithrix dorotheae TaxID=70993 RepID=UPI00035D13A3|nr:hypothetical protein [Flexithrix dorotheae]